MGAEPTGKAEIGDQREQRGQQNAGDRPARPQHHGQGEGGGSQEQADRPEEAAQTALLRPNAIQRRPEEACLSLGKLRANDSLHIRPKPGKLFPRFGEGHVRVTKPQKVAQASPFGINE